MIYHFKVHNERGGGYWADCIELEGCRAQAETRSALLKKMQAALNLYLSEPPDSKFVFPPPRKISPSKNIAPVSAHPSVAMANRIRELRLKNNLTQVGMKDRLGIKNLSNYQRLEDPKRANPEWQTLVMIKKAFPKFRVDDLMSVV